MFITKMRNDALRKHVVTKISKLSTTKRRKSLSSYLPYTIRLKNMLQVILMLYRSTTDLTFKKWYTFEKIFGTF